MIAPARQRQFVLPDEPVYCPMTTIGGVRDRLAGHNEDDVLALIEEDKVFPWAWDISAEHADRVQKTRESRARREVRILTVCIDHYKRTGKPLDWPWQRVQEEILCGYCKPWIPGTRVQIILNCGTTLVSSLLANRSLAVLPGTSWQTGPGGSPQITLASFQKFLQQRLIIQVRAL